MYRTLLRVFFILICLSIFSIDITYGSEFEKIDEIVNNYPSRFSKIEKLAEMINNDFKTDEDKARAIFTWIASNVEYDYNLLETKNKRIKFTYNSEEERIQKESEILYEDALRTLKRKKAVCEGYSSLFKVLCDLNDLECVKVHGFSKVSPRYIGKTHKIPDHTWNAVKVNGQWKLIDVTWAAGHKDEQSGKFVKHFSDTYFFTNPEDFSLNHFPLEEKWLFTDKTFDEFNMQPYVYDFYITSNIELSDKSTGLLQMNNDKIVSLELKGDNIGELEYTTNNGRTFLYSKPDVINGISKYQFKVSGSFLEIFIDHNAWAIFRIKR